MKKFKEIYNIKNDHVRIKMIQEASLDKNSKFGYKIENGLLFGSIEWFKAIDNGQIKPHIVEGYISKVFNSGHDDFPEFEIQTTHDKSSWPRRGDDGYYEIGQPIILVYVEQRYKRPIDPIGPISKCVIEIKIGSISKSL